MSKKWYNLIGISICVLIFISLNFYLILKEDSKIGRSALIEERTNTVVKDLKKRLPVDGVVVADEEAQIYYDSKIGILEEVLVTKGQAVQQGTPLVRYRNIEVQAEKEEFETLKQQKEAEKKKLEASIKELEELKRTVEQANLRSETTKTQVQGKTEAEGTTNIIIEKAPSYESLVVLNKEIKDKQFELIAINNDQKRYERKITAANEKVAALTVTSSISGMVQAISRDEQKPLISIVSDPPIVKAELPVHEVTKVKEGQKVEMTSAQLPKEKLEGFVQRITYLPVDEPSLDETSMYPFTVQFDKIYDDLHYGYLIKMDVILEEHLNTIVIPKNGYADMKKGKYAYVLKDGKLHKQKITIDMRIGFDQEVTKGLTDKDLIVLNPTNQLAHKATFVTPIEFDELSKKEYKHISQSKKSELVFHGLLTK